MRVLLWSSPGRSDGLFCISSFRVLGRSGLVNFFSSKSMTSLTKDLTSNHVC